MPLGWLETVPARPPSPPSPSAAHAYLFPGPSAVRITPPLWECSLNACFSRRLIVSNNVIRKHNKVKQPHYLQDVFTIPLQKEELMGGRIQCAKPVVVFGNVLALRHFSNLVGPLAWFEDWSCLLRETACKAVRECAPDIRPINNGAVEHTYNGVQLWGSDDGQWSNLRRTVSPLANKHNMIGSILFHCSLAVHLDPLLVRGVPDGLIVDGANLWCNIHTHKASRPVLAIAVRPPLRARCLESLEAPAQATFWQGANSAQMRFRLIAQTVLQEAIADLFEHCLRNDPFVSVTRK